MYHVNQAPDAELGYRGLLQLILEKAREVVSFEHGSIHRVYERLNRLVVESSIGSPERTEPRRSEMGYGITGWVAKYGRPLCIADIESISEIPDVPEQPRYVPLVENTRSQLCVPLKTGTKVIGVLNIESSQVGAFSKRDQEQLETLASLAATAIENAGLHAELEKVYKELEQEQQRRITAEKYSYLGMIAASFAHRLNNVAGMVRVCERELRKLVDLQDDEVRDNLDTIQEETEYMLALADGLFKPTQASEARMQPTDLNLLLKDAVNHARIPDGINVACTYAVGLPLIPANKWFVEMFVELIANAVKAMGDKGELGIGSRLTSDGWAEVWFKDTGHGIPPENRERIFDLFFSKREGEEGRGFGFGLWWIKTFLLRIGGSIEFDSQVGIGTTFLVKLPTSDV